MKLNYKPNHKNFKSFLVIIILFLPQYSPSWGFYAHKKINEMAIYTLPEPLKSFFIEHMNEIIQMAILPDQRRYILDQEAAKHYMDLDYYHDLEIFNIDSISYPKKINYILKEEQDQHGIAAWNLPLYYHLLKKAFKEKNKDEIIKKSAELGHYLADLHVPLHTSSNYDGQKTNQTGLHSLWESKIPELIKEDLFQFVGKAEYIKNFNDSAWSWIWYSHSLLDQVFQQEKSTRKMIPKKKQFQYEKKGNLLIRRESDIFIKKYQENLQGMVENQFNLAVKHLGDSWYSAWLEAGQPDL